MKTDRKDILLRAAFDLLKRCNESHYVLEAGSTLIRYDDANCDGSCLMEDIAHELQIPADTDPIPLSKED